MQTTTTHTNTWQRALAVALAALGTAGCASNDDAPNSGSSGCDAPGADSGCGAGGGGEGGGGAGGPTLLAEGQRMPESIRADETQVWWLNQGATTVSGGGLSWNGSLMALALAGGEPAELASNEATPRDLDVDMDTATAVWVETFQGSGEPYELRALPLDGGAPVTLATEVGAAAAAAGAAFVGTFEGIVRIPLPDGGTPVVLHGVNEVNDIAADDAHVYWATSAGEVKRMAQAAGTPSLIADGRNQPYGLAARGGMVVWFEADGSIWSSTDAAAPALVATAPSQPWSLAIDATHVYVGASDFETMKGAIYRAPLGGGALETLAAIEGLAPSVAVNATDVFWIDPRGNGFETGAVYGMPK